MHVGNNLSASLRAPSVALPLLGVAALALAAGINHYLAKKAERKNPPVGKIIDVNGVRIHYLERGSGETVVLLHGNGSMIEDFLSSGLIDMAGPNCRVVAFDRPGFGHSTRPRRSVWTPEAQAEIIYGALSSAGVTRAKVFGHSWGTSVAIALALKHPELVTDLVLASGYYYPTIRADALVLSVPGWPLIGDILSHTISPLLSRLLWPMLLRKIFGPEKVPAKFKEFPKEMALRPSQIRASAVEAGLMIPCAVSRQEQYQRLNMPITIIAGEKDRLIDIDEQSARLHRNLKNSRFIRVPSAGHMVHQTETERVVAAIMAA